MLDADIRSFFDTVDHGWMMRFLEHRIADRRMLRLITKWLNAGVMENGIRTAVWVGTPQGAVISPLLGEHLPSLRARPLAASLAMSGRQGRCDRRRYADDSVVGFEFTEDAPRVPRQPCGYVWAQFGSHAE